MVLLNAQLQHRVPCTVPPLLYLQQPNPVFYSGRAKHSGCGKRLDIKEVPKMPNKPGVRKWCPHCQKVAYFSIKGHNLLKVVKGKVVKRKR